MTNTNQGAKTMTITSIKDFEQKLVLSGRTPDHAAMLTGLVSNMLADNEAPRAIVSEFAGFLEFFPTDGPPPNGAYFDELVEDVSRLVRTLSGPNAKRDPLTDALVALAKAAAKDGSASSPNGLITVTQHNGKDLS